MLFVNPVLDTTANGRVLDESRQFERYSGRRIGEVVIAQDPVFTPDGNWLERTGNKLHVMTRERVLRRLFGDTRRVTIIVPGDSVQALSVQEVPEVGSHDCA